MSAGVPPAPASRSRSRSPASRSFLPPPRASSAYSGGATSEALRPSLMDLRAHRDASSDVPLSSRFPPPSSASTSASARVATKQAEHSARSANFSGLVSRLEQIDGGKVGAAGAAAAAAAGAAERQTRAASALPPRFSPPPASSYSSSSSPPGGNYINSNSSNYPLPASGGASVPYYHEPGMTNARSAASSFPKGMHGSGAGSNSMNGMTGGSHDFRGVGNSSGDGVGHHDQVALRVALRGASGSMPSMPRVTELSAPTATLDHVRHVVGAGANGGAGGVASDEEMAAFKGSNSKNNTKSNDNKASSKPAAAVAQSMISERRFPNVEPPPSVGALRRMLFDDNGSRIDLLKAASFTRTTLGLHIGLNSGLDDVSPTQIQSVIPGGPAHMEGSVLRGDEIVAVDGHAVSETDLVSRVRGVDMIGSQCVLTLRRGSETVQARLRRTPAARVEDNASVYDGLEAVGSLVKCGSGGEEVMRAIRRVARAVTESEMRRIEAEGAVATTLSLLAEQVGRAVDDCLRVGDMPAFGKDTAGTVVEKKEGGAVTEAKDQKITRMQAAIAMLESELEVRMDHARVVQGQLGAAQDANAKLEGRIVSMELEIESLREQAESRKVKENAAERASNEAALLLEGLRNELSAKEAQAAASFEEAQNLKIKLAELTAAMGEDADAVERLAEAIKGARPESGREILSLLGCLGREGRCSVREAVEILGGGVAKCLLTELRVEGEQWKRQTEELQGVVRVVRDQVKESDRRCQHLDDCLQDATAKVSTLELEKNSARMEGDVQRRKAEELMRQLADSNQQVLSLKADLEASVIARDSAVAGIQECGATALSDMRLQMEAAQTEASALRDSLARCTADLEESNRHAMVLSEELEAGRETEKGWKADVGRLEEEIRALKSKVAISRDDADSKDREMEAERQKFKDLVAANDRGLLEAKDMIAALQDEKTHLESSLASTLDECSSQKSRIGQLVESLEKATSEIGRIESELAVGRDSAKAADGLLEEVRREKDALFSSLEEARRERDALIAKLEDAQRDASEADIAVGKAQGIKMECQVALRDLEQARDKVLRLSEQLEWSNAELEATRAEADRLGKDLDDIKGSERGFESVLRDTRAELDLIRTERDSLLMSEANMSKELSESRGALSAVKAEGCETLAKLVKAAEGERMVSIKLEGCKKKLEGALAELKGCKKELEGALGDKDDMALKLEGCKKELEGALTELVSCKIEASELDGKLSLCRNEVGQVGEQLSMTLKEVVSLRTFRDESRKDCEGVLDEIRNLAGEVDNLSHLLTQSQSNNANVKAMLEMMGNLRLGKDGGCLISCQEVMTLLEVASLTPERSMTENAAILQAFNVLERESQL